MQVRWWPQMCLLGVSTFQPYYTPFHPRKTLFWGHFPWFSIWCHRYRSPKLTQELVLWYVGQVRVLDVPFGGFDLSTPLHPLPPPKNAILGSFSTVFYMVSWLQVTQIDLRACPLVCRLGEGPRCAFWGFRPFNPFTPPSTTEKRYFGVILHCFFSS